MTALGFVLAIVKTALVVIPAVLSAHLVRVRFSSVSGLLAWLTEAVVALCLPLLCGELAGLVGGLRFGWLAALLWLVAGVAFFFFRVDAAAITRAEPRRDSGVAGAGVLAAGLVVWLVTAQWVLLTADALGGGMGSFDVLWYHLPFAAVFAQTGSVTGVHFTQADPFVAYYPANSELFHAVGIIAFGNDFLSPFLNLGWLLLGSLGAWCVGRRWHLEWWTLATGALLFSLPVLSTTQPGEAFNDVVGLAALTVAVALILAPERGPLELLAAGLALGLAAGTKYTFLVPAAALLIGVIVVGPKGRRKRAGVVLVGGFVLTSAWWYVRALVHTGNPLGIAQTLGPLRLSGPRSPLADASRQTVLSELHHTSLWSTRFAPGLAHAFGPLWPLILLAAACAIIAALVTAREPLLRVIAVAALLSAVSYLLLPTGATGIQQSTILFAVNLRYATPALALGLLLLPMVVANHGTVSRALLAIAIISAAVLAQLEPNVWPARTGRHVAFLLAAGVGLTLAAALFRNPPTRSRRAALTGLATAIALVGAGYVVQHHYFQQRYLVREHNAAGIHAIYRWAQTVSHTRIALYGTVEQYPLYGAKTTNSVDYLGQPTPNGGYEPVTSCTRWQTLLQTGNYRYLVLTPGPTAAIPPAWTQQDPNLTPILHSSPNDWVFEILPRHLPTHCSRA